MKKLEVYTFEGKITCKDPLIQVEGKGSEGKPSAFRRENFLVPTVTDNDGVGVRAVSVPTLSPNTLRAKLRDLIAHDITDALGDRGERLGYRDLVIAYVGGGGVEAKDAKAANKTDAQSAKLSANRVYDLVNRLRANHIGISLFGASVGPTMISGKVSVGIPVLECEETIAGGHIPGIDKAYARNYPQAHQFVYVAQNIRHDNLKDPDVFRRLSETGQAEYVAAEEKIEGASNAKAAQKAAKKAGQAYAGAEDDTKDQKRQMIFSSEALPAGTVFHHTIEVRNPSPAELGALVNGLARLAREQFVGGVSSRGYGAIKIEYVIKRNGEKIGGLAAEHGEHGENKLDAKNDDCLSAARDAYVEYLGNISVADITAEAA